jgi:hypothetical protein
VDRKRKSESSAEAEFSPGMLMASGLIAGGAIAGVVQSVIAFREGEAFFDLSAFTGGFVPEHMLHTWWPMIPFLLMAAILYVVGSKRSEGGR